MEGNSAPPVVTGGPTRGCLSQVNTTLIYPKLFFFTFFASTVCTYPFIPIYYRSVGMSEALIGLAGGLRKVVAAMVVPWAGSLADQMQRPKLLVIACFLGSTWLAFSYQFFNHFAALLALTIAVEVLGLTVPTLMDIATLQLLVNKGDYGKQRLWGAVGWGTTSVMIGELIDRVGLWAIFPCQVAVASSCLLVIARFPPWSIKRQPPPQPHLPSPPHHDIEEAEHAFPQEHNEHGRHQEHNESEKDEGEHGSHEEGAQTTTTSEGMVQGLRAVLDLLREPHTMAFLLTAAVMGAAMGTIENYLFLYLEEMGGSKLLMGLTLTVTCAAEIPAMFFSGRLIDKLGVDGVWFLVLICFVIRAGYYSLLTTPWAVLPVEVLHGVTFGCAYTAGTLHLQQVAPPQLANTVQSIFTSIYFGYGNGTGILIAGFVYKRFGGATMFRGLAIAVLVTLGAYFAFVHVLRSRRPVAEGFAMLPVCHDSLDEHGSPKVVKKTSSSAVENEAGTQLLAGRDEHVLSGNSKVPGGTGALPHH
eukprot:jgi/Mesvir1/831/Mv17412-RA.1